MRVVTLKVPGYNTHSVWVSAGEEIKLCVFVFLHF